MWSYQQSTGELWNDGFLIGTGYSGMGEGKNSPSMQNMTGIGPIPCGRYRIGPPTEDHPGLGKAPVMALMPIAGTGNMFGRSGFFMHGDSNNHNASHGCIVIDHSTRQRVADSNDRDLMVRA